jgi:hypothetical protein
MISNLPVVALQQEFQARHSDMLAAARRGKLADPNEVVVTIEQPVAAFFWLQNNIDSKVIWSKLPDISDWMV